MLPEAIESLILDYKCHMEFVQRYDKVVTEFRNLTVLEQLRLIFHAFRRWHMNLYAGELA